MEFQVKITQVIFFVGLLLCSELRTVESAPAFENSHEIGSTLHVLPLEQSVTVGVPSDEPITTHSRNKRAIIFRPLFVYRQQQIKKHRVQNAPVPQTVVR